MYIFPSRLVMLAAFVAMAFSAPAQQTIIFSKPADLSSTKANSFLSGSQHQAGDYNAPHSLFNDYTPDLPLPKPIMRNNNDASVKDALDRQKNWTLLTPEQILGIQTPEQILGVPDRSGEKGLSLEEKFLLREQRSEAMTTSNSRAGNAYWRETSDDNPFAVKKQNDENNPYRQTTQPGLPGTRNFNPLFNLNEQSPGAVPEEKQRSHWNSVFFQPSPPKPDPEQVADMERFRALMQPSLPPDTAPGSTRYSATPAPAPAPDPYLQAVPVVNPAGRDIPPLANEYSRPTGINPLPAVSTPVPKPVAAKPSWQAQPPPWTLSGPKPHAPNWSY